MSGYLQRLMRTVTNPAESVHPWAGSIFAAVDRGDFNVVQTEELAPAAAARESSEVMSPASAQYSSQPSVPTQASLPGAGHNSQASDSRTMQIAAGFPQAEPSAAHGPSVSERIIFEPLISYIERSSSDGAATELEMTPAQEPETALPPHARRSLARTEFSIKPRNSRRLAVGSSPALPAKTGAPAVGSRVAGDQQTDEIQIHIGRIEVTAIYPPTPTVPKVRTKEISLDAYLKRRDGSSR
jgi:hypothetical protein